MGRPRTRPIIKTECAYCKKSIEKTANIDHPQYNYFCCMEHRNIFKIGKPGIRKYNNDTLINEYKRICNALGRLPSADDIRKYSEIFITVFQKRFGTLDNIAKIAFPGLDINYDDWNIENISDTDGGWLAGICSGEACFRISISNNLVNGVKYTRYSATFSIQLRADDIQTLVEMNRLWAINKPIMLWDREKDRKRGINAGDGAKLQINSIPILYHRIIPTLTKYPMRGKKQNELPFFNRGVQIIYNKRALGRRNANWTDEEKIELNQIYWAMRDAKKYKTTLDELLRNYSAVMLG